MTCTNAQKNSPVHRNCLLFAYSHGTNGGGTKHNAVSVVPWFASITGCVVGVIHGDAAGALGAGSDLAFVAFIPFESPAPPFLGGAGDYTKTQKGVAMDADKKDKEFQDDQSEPENNESSQEEQEDDNEKEEEQELGMDEKTRENAATFFRQISAMERDLEYALDQLQDLKQGFVIGILVTFVVCFGLTIYGLVWIAGLQTELQQQGNSGGLQAPAISIMDYNRLKQRILTIESALHTAKWERKYDPAYAQRADIYGSGTNEKIKVEL